MAALGASATAVRRVIERHPLAVLTLLAAVPRFAWLGRAPADVDETWSWYAVHLVGERGLGDVLAVGIDGPLYTLLNLAVAEGFGASLLALRLLPAVAGTLAVPVVFAIVDRLHARGLAFATAALCALSPFLIFYSKQARPYSLLLLTCLVFVRAAVTPGPRRDLRMAGAAVLAMAAHYYALVFLATFHGLRLGAHLLARRRAEAWREVRCGATVLAACSPFVAALLWRLGSLSVRHWERDGLDLPAVWTEQVYFLGSSLGAGPDLFAWLNRAVVLLWLAPFAAALWRRPRRFLEEPLLLLGWAVPVAVVLAGGLIGQSYLFYPRGFIAATPFLLLGWALLTRELRVPAWLRAGYAALLIAPLLLSAVSVTRGDPGHPYFEGREVMREIVETAVRHRDEYDLVLVHHWWLAQYVAFYHPEPELVRGLGMWRRGASARSGELAAVLQDAAALPPDARILLVRNDLVAAYGDPGDAVIAALRARGRTVRALPCREHASEQESMFCDGMFLFGPESTE